MTDESCVAFCDGKHYNYAGTEYGGECYCGTSILAAASPVNNTDCNMPCTGNSSESCGAAYRISIYNSGQPAPGVPIVNPGPGNWTSVGCYTDGVNSRTLSTNPGTLGGVDNATVGLCMSACTQGGYILGGLEYGGQCWCGNTFDNYNGPAPDGASGCNMPCNGNYSEICGGSNRLSMYSTLDWKMAGCYNDTSTAHALPYMGSVAVGSAGMTPLNCTAACQTGKYILAGVEGGGSCYCGSTLQNNSTMQAASNCATPCNGNNYTTCGGTNYMNLYTFRGSLPATTSSPTSTSVFSTSQSSTSSTTVAVTTTTKSSTTSSTKSTTTKTTTSKSTSSTITTKSTTTKSTTTKSTTTKSSSTKSITSTTTKNTTSTTPKTTTTTTSSTTLSVTTTSSTMPTSTMTTIASTTGITISTSKSSSSSTSSSSSSVSSSTNSTTLAATTTPTTTSATYTNTFSATGGATALPSGWSYYGCYAEPANARALSYQITPDSSNNTIEYCVSECITRNYTIAGMEYGQQCFCDNYMHGNATLATSQADCNMACAGSSKEICGAGNHLSVYATAPPQNYTAPAAQRSGIPGSWIYQGCLVDQDGARTFPYEIQFPTNNSATTCLGLCAQFGYNAGGMEYSQQCMCGDIQNVIDANRTVLAPESDCSMACPQNSSQICGGPSRISYYQWSNATSPLASWNFATGNAAGAYEFLIGGVIIPLMATPGINGKVTFLEKFGTEPSNNSTGAYELDLAQLTNFTGAWRPMHVKTDVFCSAGLVLPDKVGRQINIGGWANDATYAVRLYWPDGSPGTWGVNDWQENVAEIGLQAGRWYPTAMTMANGSILVMGGEQGSNGAAVPSLELLPRVGPVVYCDYLARTDPYNLYPFLAVLPSGGIFVQYYNEARILDEGTLQTLRTLPNVPGAVDNPAGGRNYPFSGTMMLLPQAAPYTDPLTVLICGGSSPYEEQGLDNCVSIQPDVPGQNWTIERMPSKRVISCMTALPDGTFLILNGALAGRAGFGLARNPNLNAVLYDPSKPLNQRMTVMANTTVARLYHSEAVLLDDGRVLVTGSDPEMTDSPPTYPQEYRVEVFVPPYLMGGAPRPTFTVSSRDVPYGGIFTVKITSALSGTYKMALMGAVSSTHGVSMGGRTFYPAMSCSGATCTVTAMPNAHIAPPAWYQAFLLQNGVPSVATWIRVGGDPGAIGNWPAGLSDFTVPGV